MPVLRAASRQLVAQRFAAAGRHQHQRIVAGGDVVDDGGLLAAKGLKPKISCSWARAVSAYR